MRQEPQSGMDNICCTTSVCVQVWEERDREFVAAGDLTMDEDCLILLIDADTKVRDLPAVPTLSKHVHLLRSA